MKRFIVEQNGVMQVNVSRQFLMEVPDNYTAENIKDYFKRYENGGNGAAELFEYKEHGIEWTDAETGTYHWPSAGVDVQAFTTSAGEAQSMYGTDDLRVVILTDEYLEVQTVPAPIRIGGMEMMPRSDSLGATGFAFKPLPDGDVLIEFQADDGKTINKQIVTVEVIRQMPLVGALLEAAMRIGPEATAHANDTQTENAGLPHQSDADQGGGSVLTEADFLDGLKTMEDNS